jgi:uncharacterized protein
MSPFLSQFLGASERPKGTLTYNELRGFLYSIACAPEPVRPVEWLPLVFNDQDADYTDMDEARTVIRALMEQLELANHEVSAGKVILPDDIEIRTPALENVGEAAALGQWSRGFFLGHNWLIELWNQRTPKPLGRELRGSLMVLSFFSSEALAEAFYKQTEGAREASMDEFASGLLGMFENAMNRYARLGRAIQAALARHQEKVKDFDTEMKTFSRTDPCPCGSGREFGKCCLH